MCEGIVPAWRDERGMVVTYASEREAQIEIAEMMIEHLRQFIDGARVFDDASMTGDFVLPVKVWPNGAVETEWGRRFDSQES